MRNHILRWVVPLAWGVLCWAVASALVYPVGSSDLWWHLASGREMFENKVFLWRDVFSHTLYGAEWINFEWASQLLFYALYKTVGFWGLLWVQVLLGMAAWGAGVLIARKSGLRGALLFFSATLCFKLLQPRLFLRPEVVSVFFFCLLILIVQHAWEASKKGSPASTETPRYLLVGILGVVWVNSHGGFIYGLGLLTLLWAGALWAKERKEFIRFLERSLIIFSCAFLINPHGPALIGVMIEHLFQLRDNMVFIQEWGMPRATRAPFFWALFLCVWTLIIRDVRNDAEKNRLWIPAAIVFSIWGVISYRNTFFLGVVCLPLVGSHAALYQWPRFLDRTQTQVALWAAAGVLIFASIFNYKGLPNNPVVYKFPVEQCDFIMRHDIRGTMYNTYGYGGFIEWVLGPERKVFIDGRYIFQPFLVEMGHLEKGMAQSLNKKGWRDFLERHGVDYAIVDYWGETRKFIVPGIPFPLTFFNGVLPREEWALVCWDDAGMVFLKRVPKFADLIARFEYRHLRPFNLDQMKALIESGLISRGEARMEIERHAREVAWSIKRLQLEELVAPPVKR